jgi:hypothetical protein
MGGQAASGVTLRSDLRSLLEEYDFTRDQKLMAEVILPTIPVVEAAAHYPTLPRENRLRIPDTARAKNGTYSRDQWEYSEGTYTTREYGHEETIDISQAAVNSSWVDEEEISSQMAAQKLMLAREQRVASAVYNTTTFTGATNTGAITNEWDDSTNATPWADIENAAIIVRAKCGLQKSNLSLILSDDLIKFLLKCTEVINSIQYTESIPTMAEERKLQFAADYLGIKQVIGVTGLYETTKIGQPTPAMGHLWSSEYAMLCKLNTVSRTWKEIGLGRQPAFSKVTDTYLIEEYSEPATRSLVIRALEYRGTTVNSDYGYLLSNMKTTVSNGL